MGNYKLENKFILEKTNIEINNNLLNYLNQKIQEYNNFDKAHDLMHVRDVIIESIEKYNNYKYENDLNLEMVITIAIYHDLGLGIEQNGLSKKEVRKNHHIYSKEIVLADEFLKSYFNEEEIIVIANAVEDHRASNSSDDSKKARDIYGMIVSDADRTLVVDTIIYRYLVSRERKTSNEDSNLENYIDELMEAIYTKYNKETGYLKFYLKISDELEKQRDLLIKIVSNKELFIYKAIEIIKNKNINMDYKK